MTPTITFYSNGSISIDHKNIDAHFERYDNGKQRFRSSDPRFSHLDRTRVWGQYTDEQLKADMLEALK